MNLNHKGKHVVSTDLFNSNFIVDLGTDFFFTRFSISVPLQECSSFVLQQVIDLFYNGHVMVGAEVKPRIFKALQFLKVDGIVVQNAAPQQNSTPNEDIDKSLNQNPTSNIQNSSQQGLKREKNTEHNLYNNQHPVKRARLQSTYVSY